MTSPYGGQRTLAINLKIAPTAETIPMTAAEFETRIVDWARQQSDLQALVQIGSRVQTGATVDEWSDWDYYLITRDVGGYRDATWLRRIAPYWGAHLERTARSTWKMSAVFAGGIEADFVLLAEWQMKLACWSMRHRRWQRWFPPSLHRGLHNLRLFAGPGHRVLVGGAAWERRLAVITDSAPPAPLSADAFATHVSGFWRHAIWVFKKLSRGEHRAALRWHQIEVMEQVYPILQEEARLEGQNPRPEARLAEHWLPESRLQQTNLTLAPNRELLAQALIATIDLFLESSRAVARARGFNPPAASDIESWLKHELRNIRESSENPGQPAGRPQA